MISSPNSVDSSGTTSPSPDTVRYTAPELLNPSGFGLEDSIPTKESDIYAFGMVAYQVGSAHLVSTTTTEDNFKVTTGLQPFPMTNDGTIVHDIVTGERPCHPPGPNEWVTDIVWDFISRCWGPSRDGRPDVDCIMNILNDVADAIEVRRGEAANNQRKRASRPVPGAPHEYRL